MEYCAQILPQSYASEWQEPPRGSRRTQTVHKSPGAHHLLKTDDGNIAPETASGAGGSIVADIQQRVTSLEERGQAHDTGIGELRKDIGDLRVELRKSVAELRTDIAAVRGDMVHRSEIAELRAEVVGMRGDMVHRSDLADLRTEIGGMRGDMVHRSEMAELRAEVVGMRGDMVHRSDLADLRGDMSHLRNDMNQRFAAVDQKFTWLVGIQVAGLVAVIGALVGSYYR